MPWIPSTPVIRLLILFVGFLLFYADYPLILWVHESVTPPFRLILSLITEIGEAWPWFGFFFLIFLWGRRKTIEFQRYISRPALFTIYNMLFVGFVLNVLKFIIGRPRPKHFLMHGLIEPDPCVFTNPFALSFPSGHAQAIWSIAICLGLYWPQQRKIFWSIAVIVALSRFLLGHHYLSDVIIGSGVGIVGSLWFHKRYAHTFLLGKYRYAWN